MKCVSKWNSWMIVLFPSLMLVGCKNSNEEANLSSENNPISIQSAVAANQILQPGTWGSRTEGSSSLKFINALLNVSENGATLELGCGEGLIIGPIVLDATGSFQADGEFQFRGGPEPIDGYPVYSAFFYGQVNGNNLTLNYTIDNYTLEGPGTVHTLKFQFGVSGNLLQCH